MCATTIVTPIFMIQLLVLGKKLGEARYDGRVPPEDWALDQI